MNLDEILKRIRAGIQNTASHITQPIQQAVSKEVHQLPQQAAQVAKSVVNGVGNTPLLWMQPRVGLNLPTPKPIIGPTLGQYTQGQIAKPIQSGVKQVATGRNVIEKGLGAAQAAGGVLSATPTGALFNLGVGGTTGILKTLRSGGDLNQNVSRAIANPTSFAQEGLGIKNHPVIATGVDLLATRSPKSLLKDPTGVKTVVKGAKSLSSVLSRPYVNDAARQVTENRDTLLNTIKQGDLIFDQNIPVSFDHQSGVIKNIDTAYKQLYGASKKAPPNVIDRLNAVKRAFKELSTQPTESAGGGFKSGFVETPKISNDLTDALQGAQSSQDEAQIIHEFTDNALQSAQGNSLKATRAALNQELQGVAGVSGAGHKGDYAAIQALKNSPDYAPRINALEDNIAKIDEKLKGGSAGAPPNVGGGKPLSQVTNPTKPFYNVKRVGVSPAKQQNLKTFVEESGKEISASGGKPLTHQEIITAAKANPKATSKLVTREQTEAIGAANLNLRNEVGRMAKEGKMTPEFLTALQQDKAAAENLARLLGQRAITSNPDSPVMEQVVREILKRNQNTDEILKAAQGVDFNDANQAAGFYRQFVKPSLGNYVDLIRYNSMLSSPITHIVNATSNTLNSGVVAPIEKTLTGTIDYLSSVATGKKQTQFASEGAAYVQGYWSNLGTASHSFADVLRGKRQTTNLDLRGLSPLHGQKGDTLFSLPTRLLEASDQFFTALTQGGEKAALSLRKAKGGFKGNVDLQASENAAYRLFRSELHDKRQGAVLNTLDNFTELIQRARNYQVPENANQALKDGAAITRTVAKFTLPFVRTPMNIFKQMIEYSPAGVATLPGAANKTEQLSKAIMGTAGMTAAMMLLTSGRTTWAEPTDPKKRAAFRAAGLQPYALKIGDNWVSYSKLPPAMSIPLAITSALHNASENKTIDQSQLDAVLTGIASVGGFFSDQSYLKNIGDAISATKGSPEEATRFVGNYPQQLVPYRAFLGWLSRLTDPYQRKVDTDASILQQQVQNLLKEIPLASGRVPARLGPDGEPILNQNRVTNALSPLKVTTERPAQKETYDLMQQKSLTNKNIKAAKTMILKGENPDLSTIEFAAASDLQETLKKQNTGQALQQKARDDVTKQKVKLIGDVQHLSNGDLAYTNKKGDLKTLSLTPPTKGQGIDAFSNENWQYNKAREVWKADLPQKYKDEAFKKLGVKADDVRYDYLAHHSTDESVKYIASKNLSHDELMKRLVTGRVVSVTGQQFASNPVIDQLYAQGLVSKAEAKELKKIKLDKDGKSLVKQAAGKGTGSKKAKALASFFSKQSLELSKLFQSQVKNTKPTNTARLEKVLQNRRPANTGLASLQSILAKSEATVKKKKDLKTILGGATA